MKNLNKYKSNLQDRAYNLSLNLIIFINSLPKIRSCWIIGDQLLRSGTSIGANLVEAVGSSSKLEFRKFHLISLRSANETKYWLCLIRDSTIVNKNNISQLIQEVTEISNMIAAGIIKMKNSK